LLIFTLIFSPKTNKSYKITLFTITNHPVFQKNSQKPLFSVFLLFFYPRTIAQQLLNFYPATFAFVPDLL